MSSPAPLPRGWKAAIVSAALFAFALKILLALNTFGTNDVYAWERFAHWTKIFGAAIYGVDPAFNHPPSMIHALRVLLELANITGVPFAFWLRLPAILADTSSLWIVYLLFARRLNEPGVRWTLLLLALSPVLILVSGFHGNTDPVMMFFVLLSVWLTENEAGDWASGAAFGVAMCVKILPVILAPAFVLYRPELRRRATFLAAMSAVIAVLWAPYVYLNPRGVMNQVLGYGSIYGDWGIAWVVYHLFPLVSQEWHDDFHLYGAKVLIALLAIASWGVNRKPEKPGLYAQSGAVLFVFLAAANGFGVQYLAWLAPWTVGVALLPAAFFTAAAGAFLLLTYNYWSGGSPWYLADSNYVGSFTPHLDYFLVLCWLSVIVLTWAACKPRMFAAFPARRVRAGFCVLATAGIAFPGWQQLHTDERKYPAAVDHVALAAVHAEEQASLSAQYAQMGRLADAVVAARVGVGMDPTVVSVWNSLTRACIGMERWDEALYAANKAARLAPQDEAANANLAEVLARRR